MRTGLFIVVSIDIILICWVLRDLLLWHLKINKKIEILEKTLGMMMLMFNKLKKNYKPQEYKPKEAFIQEKIRINAKRRINKSETPGCMMAEVENYTQPVGIYNRMKK